MTGPAADPFDAPASAGAPLDRRLALWALGAIPVLSGLVLGTTLAFGPLAGWVTGLLGTWAALGGALLAWADRDWLAHWLRARWPGWTAALLLLLPVVVLGASTLRLLGQDPLPAHLLLAAAIAAVVQAGLAELYWRGALIPEPTPRSAAVSLGLFALAQLPWVAAWGLETGWPAWGAPLAAVALGGAWTAARLTTGTVGAALLSHAGVNLFAFAQVIALNA